MKKINYTRVEEHLTPVLPPTLSDLQLQRERLKLLVVKQPIIPFLLATTKQTNAELQNAEYPTNNYHFNISQNQNYPFSANQ